MSKYFFISIFLILLSLFGCNKDDENLKPSGIGEDWNVIQDKPGRFNQLAYQVYKETGFSLYVNDTLSTENRGVDAFGHPVIHYEMFVMGYSIFSQLRPADIVLSADTVAMVKAGELIRDKVIPRYMPGYVPFCILMVDSLYTNARGWNPNKGVLPYATPEYAYKEMMGVVVGYLSDIRKMSEDEQNMWAGRVLAVQIASEIQSRYKDELQEFYNVCMNGRWTWHDEVFYALPDGTPYTVGYDVDYRERGFLELVWEGKFSEMRLVRKYPSQAIDVVGYLAAVYAFSEDKFEELYKDYPYCIEKYKLMKAILTKFEAEISK